MGAFGAEASIQPVLTGACCVLTAVDTDKSVLKLPWRVPQNGKSHSLTEGQCSG